MPRVGLTGDFAKIAEWQKRAKGLNDKALQDLSDNLAEEALELVADGFRKERDPHGKRWQPKAFGEGRAILVGRTARLRRGWHRKSSSKRGFTIGPSVDYAKYHQSGTGVYAGRGRIHPKQARALAWKQGGKRVAFASVKGVPARKMVPSGRRLPANWSKAFAGTAQLFLRKHFAR